MKVYRTVLVHDKIGLTYCVGLFLNYADAEEEAKKYKVTQIIQIIIPGGKGEEVAE